MPRQPHIAPAASAHDLLERLAEHVQRPAVKDLTTGTSLSYADLNEAMDRCATALAHEGLTPGSTVGICLPNSAGFVIAYHGALRAGGVVLPLDPDVPAEEQRRIQAAANCHLLIDTVYVERLLQEDAEVHAPNTHAPRLRDPEGTAVLAATSGTHGLPHLVRLTHTNLAVNLSQIQTVHRLDAGDTVLATTPLRHIYAMQMAMNHTLRQGATLVILPPRNDTRALLHAMAHHRVTVAYLVPTLLERLLREPEDIHRDLDLGALRLIFSGGAPLSPDTAHACTRRLGVPVIQGYGSTEAGCTHLVSDHLADNPDSGIGALLPGTQARLVVPGTTHPAESGRPGELWVKGPQISPGYLDGKQPLTDEDGWYHTGDLARRDSHGCYRITGRISDLIKYQGHRIAPAELEALLLDHPDVTDAAVTGIPDPVAGQIPKAFVVLRRPTDLTALLGTVAARVPRHKKVRLVEAVDHIPRTTTGKIQRTLLSERHDNTKPSLPRREEELVRELTGQVVVITGASRGFGRAAAQAFAECGARLVLTGRDQRTLGQAADQLGGNEHVVAVAGDLTDPLTMPRVVERALDAFGTVDVLVNNAAMPGPVGPTWETDEEEWWQTMTVNLRGTLLACRAVLPVMTAAGHGRIINFTSRAGTLRWPHASAYAVSKAALIKLGENLAPELRHTGVTVFGYDPGLMDIGMTRTDLQAPPSDDPWRQRMHDWFQQRLDEGQFTPVPLALTTLLRIAAGEGDPLAGHNLTATDNLTTPAPDTEGPPATADRGHASARPGDPV